MISPKKIYVFECIDQYHLMAYGLKTQIISVIFFFIFLFEFSFYLKINKNFDVFHFLRHPMTIHNNFFFFLGFLLPFVIQTQLYFRKFSIQFLMMFVGRDEMY